MQKLPAIQDIYASKEIVKDNQELNVLLNQPPKEAWVKVHPVTNTKYIPIEKVEYLLTMIFSKWWVEVKSTVLLANSIVVTVRLWVSDPITGESSYQDGIGASPIQTNKGAGAVDFNAMKSVGVQLAAPSAESYAIKDAAEKFGKLFGKDLNRKDEMNYQGALENAIANLDGDTVQNAMDILSEANSKEELQVQWAKLNSTQLNNVEVQTYKVSLLKKFEDIK